MTPFYDMDEVLASVKAFAKEVLEGVHSLPGRGPGFGYKVCLPSFVSLPLILLA